MNAFHLKLLALICMIIDHIGHVFFSEYIIFRLIGRIAFPIFAYLTAKGIRYTKDINKYMLRLLVFALISEIAFDLAFSENINFLYSTNVIYTMLIATFTLSKYIKTNNFLYLLLGVFLSYTLDTDYNFYGVILIYIMYYVNTKPMILIYGMLWTMLMIRPTSRVYLFTVIGFIILTMYNGKQGKKSRYLFYIAYPLHIFIIYIIKEIL